MGRGGADARRVPFFSGPPPRIPHQRAMPGLSPCPKPRAPHAPTFIAKPAITNRPTTRRAAAQPAAGNELFTNACEHQSRARHSPQISRAVITTLCLGPASNPGGGVLRLRGRGKSPKRLLRGSRSPCCSGLTMEEPDNRSDIRPQATCTEPPRPRPLTTLPSSRSASRADQ
jgi:hypothetical protein